MTNAIDHLLDLMHIRSTAFVGKSLSAPWGMMIEEQAPLARFHLVVAGETWMSGPDIEKPIRLVQGDMAIIPDGKAHIYSDIPDRKPTMRAKLPDFERGAYFNALETGKPLTNLLCGYFEISPLTPPVVRTRLPGILVSHETDRASERSTAAILDLIRQELSQEREPSQITLNRLTEILCVQAINDWLSKSFGSDAEITALLDPRLATVLREIHDAPDRPWNVATLAEIYGQSRTAFTAQFKRATGLSPMNYVRRWRMQLARHMLESTALRLDEVAFKSGYADTNAFNRAFKRETGVSPGSLRRATLPT